MKRWHSIFALLIFFLWSHFSFATTQIIPKERSLKDLPSIYKTGYNNFFPVPVFETDPAEGQLYGLMPTFLFFDPDDQLVTIALASFTYNPKVVKWGGFGGIFLYPSPYETLSIFIQQAQNYQRDYDLHYLNDQLFDHRLEIENRLEYFHNPFERFFGFGPITQEGNQSNFLSKAWYEHFRIAYRILPTLKLQLRENFNRVDVHTRTLSSIPDTLTLYSSPEVGDFSQLSHRLSLVWDSRDDKDMPKSGHYIEPAIELSHQAISRKRFYYGYGLTAKKLVTWSDRLTTIVSFKMDQFFGDTVPFYLQPSLGGDLHLRGFVHRRYVDRGRILADLEQRIGVAHVNLMGTKFDFSIDPFLSFGQVFSKWSEVAPHNLQPVAGVGFRAKVPPSVIGRVDVGMGREGPVVFTSLDYPF